MSFTQVPQRPARLNRSELAVPGSSPKFFAKAAAIASMFRIPSAVSMMSSKPMRLLRPVAASICVTSMSRA